MPPHQSPFLPGKRNMPGKNKASASASASASTNGNTASRGSRTPGQDAATGAHVPSQPLSSGRSLGTTRRRYETSGEMSPYVREDLWTGSHSSRPQQSSSSTSTSTSPVHTTGLADRMKPRHHFPAARPDAFQTKPTIRRRSAADTVPPPPERTEVQLVSDDDEVADPTPVQAPPKTPVV